MGLSVTIITLNEEKNIRRAIESALFADEIILVDSGSSDQTVNIAKEISPKVHVFINQWPGWGAQKNYAAQHCSQEWIFSLDADEVISDQLRKSIETVIHSSHPNSQPNLYKSARLTNYCRHWVRYGGWYPDYQERLFRKGKALWSTPNVHERLNPIDKNEKVGMLDGDILHYSFPTFRDQLITNTNFSQRAADDYLLHHPNGPGWASILFKPLWKFFEGLLIKKGFLDGTIGLFIAINSAHAMFAKLAQAHLLVLDKNNKNDEKELS